MTTSVLLGASIVRGQTLLTTQTPTGFYPDVSVVDLGVRFESSEVGLVTAIRFYKAPGDNEPHSGELWQVNTPTTGTLLASTPFTNETNSGWQQQNLAEPIFIRANSMFVVSYTSQTYAYTQFGLSTPIVNGPLSSIQPTTVTGTDGGGNGVYNYTLGQFPDGSFRDTNYFADLQFVPVPLLSVTALPPAEQAVGQAINNGISSVVPNADFNNIFLSLSELGDPNTLAQALDQLTPRNLMLLRRIAFDNFNFTYQQIDNHLANLRFGESGWDFSRLSVQDGSMPDTLSQIRGRLLAWNPNPTSHAEINDEAKDLLGIIPTGSSAKDNSAWEQNRWSTFVSGNVILANQSTSSNVQSANYTTGGVTAGADYRFSPNWVAGTQFAYSQTHADLDSSGSRATINSYSPGLYAGYSDRGWYANGLVAYNYNRYAENRAIPFLSRTAAGQTNGNQISCNSDGGYEFKTGPWTFGPTLGLQYVHLQIDSFQENGANAADLALSDQNADSLRSNLGGEFRYQTTWWGQVKALPHFSASWQHEYLGNSNGITSEFPGQGTGSFTVQGESPERDSALMDAGIDTVWNKALDFFVDYEAQAGQSHFFAQSVNAGFRIAF